MHSTAFSLVRIASRRPEHRVVRLMALVVGFAAAGHVLAASAETNAPHEWNVDYPSQIGPNDSHVEKTAASPRAASLRTASARSGWIVDYPSQIGTEGPLVPGGSTPMSDDALRTSLGAVDRGFILNVDFPSQIGPEGPSANAPQGTIADLSHGAERIERTNP